MLHPDLDGIPGEHITWLTELDWIGQRLLALSAIERLLDDSDQRLMLMRARSLYAARARDILTTLNEHGFDWNPEMAARDEGLSVPARNEEPLSP